MNESSDMKIGTPQIFSSRAQRPNDSEKHVYTLKEACLFMIHALVENTGYDKHVFDDHCKKVRDVLSEWEVKNSKLKV